MYQTRELERISKKISSEIEDELNRIGLFFRIFYRIKTNESLKEKIASRESGYYDEKNKFVRDIIGIRIVVYFSDDIGIIYDYLKKFFSLVEETVDKNDATIFAPTRLNMIFRISDNQIKEFDEIINNKLVDSTFEIQLRTILSEGWHEIDHDLRYKSKQYWTDNNDLERSFNGMLATLETTEFSTLRLFEELSYRHYKKKSFVAAIKTKFRLRFIHDNLSEQLQAKIDNEFIKDFFKLDRKEVLNYSIDKMPYFPLSLENFIYFVNYKFINNKNILQETPTELIDLMR